MKSMISTGAPAISRFEALAPDCNVSDFIDDTGQDKKSIKNFEDVEKPINGTFGSFSIILAILIIMYVISTRVRKHRLAKHQWLQLFNLFVITSINAVVYFEYFNLSTGEFSNCHYFDHIFDGTTDIFLFNISMNIGYKLFTVTNNFYQFAVNGRLPEESAKRKKIIILRLINIFSIFMLCLLIFMNTYWTYINRDMVSLAWFNFYTKLFQLSMTLLNSVLFFYSHRKFRSTLNETIVPSHQKKLFMAKKMMLSMGILYLFVDLVLIFDLVTGLHGDVTNFIGAVLYSLLYLIVNYLIFAIIIGLNLDFSLQTQVMQDGQTFIVAVDKYGRELFHVKINPESEMAAAGENSEAVLRQRRRSRMSDILGGMRGGFLTGELKPVKN